MRARRCGGGGRGGGGEPSGSMKSPTGACAANPTGMPPPTCLARQCREEKRKSHHARRDVLKPSHSRHSSARLGAGPAREIRHATPSDTQLHSHGGAFETRRRATVVQRPGGDGGFLQYRFVVGFLSDTYPVCLSSGAVRRIVALSVASTWRTTAAEIAARWCARNVQRRRL